MPQLILFRHAQAEPAGKDTPEDHDRILTTRGIAEAAEAGRLLAERGFHPDAVLCSTSARARQTWDMARPSLPDTPQPRFLRAIFDAGRDYIAILRAEGRAAASLAIVGHNPTIQATAALLTGEPKGGPGQSFPTAAAAIFEFDGDWSELEPGRARLVEFIRPDGIAGH